MKTFIRRNGGSYYVVSANKASSVNLPLPYANNKDADQPAYPRSLISAIIVCCLDRFSSDEGHFIMSISIGRAS